MELLMLCCLQQLTCDALSVSHCFLDDVSFSVLVLDGSIEKAGK